MRGNDPHAILTDLKRGRSWTTQGGVFDDCILCDEHEAALSKLDDYAPKFAKAVWSLEPTKPPSWFELPANCDILVRFAYSVLLRFHYSSRDEARGVDLGPYATPIANYVFADIGVATFPVYFYVPISKEIDVRELGSFPERRRFDRFHRWSFMLDGVNYLVDIGNSFGVFERNKINGRDVARGVYIDFDDSPMKRSWDEMAAVALRSGSLKPTPAPPPYILSGLRQ